MPQLPDISRNNDFTDFDHEMIVERLSRLLSVLFPQWTDFERASGSNVLVGSFGWLGDLFGFYLNMRSRQNRVVTASERINIIQMLRLINYYMSAATAAEVTQTISLDPAVAIPDDLPIPAGTIIKDTAGSVEFRTVANAVILIGQTSVDVVCRNSQEVVDVYQSDGKANQRFGASSTPFVQDSDVVQADNGAYTRVSNFANSTASDRHYMVLVDDEDRAFWQFGDGVSGQIPSGVVTVTHEIGGGEIGNVDRETLDVIEGTFVDDGGITRNLTTINVDKAQGGENRETIGHAKEAGPASLESPNRTVASSDFRNNAKEVAGVVDAYLKTSDNDPTIRENQAWLYVVAKGDRLDSGRYKVEVATQVLLDSVYTYLTSAPPNGKPVCTTLQLRTYAAPLLSVDVVATVYLDRGTIPADWRKGALIALNDYFAALLEDGSRNPDIDFGGHQLNIDGTIVSELVWSDVFNTVRDIDGARKIDPSGLTLNGVNDSLPIASNEFPILGNVTFINGDTGSAF